MNRSTQIPGHLMVAEDVTEAEYRQAKRERFLLWSITMACALGPIIIVMILPETSRPRSPLRNLISIPVVVHLFLRYALLKNAEKMSTMRLQKYPELKHWRNALGLSEDERSES